MMETSSVVPRPGPDAEPEAPAGPGPVREPGTSESENGDPVSLSMNTTHLARFEFSDAGTKILMVEWLPGAQRQFSPTSQPQTPSQPAQPQVQSCLVPPAASETRETTDDVSSSSSGQLHRDAGTPPDSLPASTSASGADAAPWQVSWRGKSTFLPARDADLDASLPSEAGQRRRVFFLLPPDAPVPATITITPPGRDPTEVKPLPAIFPHGFFDDAESVPGSRGVLHTIWAKKRVRELEREIDAEMRTNTESVGVELALAEKHWIVDNFLRPLPDPSGAAAAAAAGMATPTSARSPVSGRLGEKLKGLRLATSPAGLAPSPTANTFTSAGTQSQTLSPQRGDIAVSSFAAMSRPAAAAAPSATITPTPVSLNEAIQGDTALPRTDDDGLFALPISPRSPDMKRSPFSTL